MAPQPPEDPHAMETAPETSPPYMAESDAIMWAIEREPRLRSTITTVLLLDRPPDADRVVAGIARAVDMVPRLRQRPVPVPFHLAPPRWVDSEVDLAYHVRTVRAPEPSGLPSVLRLAEIAAETPFDRERPLWELTVVEGLPDGRAAALLKIHHAVTDGIGGIRILALVLDLDRDAPVPAPASDQEPSRLRTHRMVLDALEYQGRRVVSAGAGAAAGTPRGACQAATTALRDPLGALSGAVGVGASVVRLLRPVPRTLSPVMRQRSLSRHFAVLETPLEELRAAGRAAGGTVNDAFVAAVTGGLHRFHARLGLAVPELRMSMPVSIRADDDPLTANRITPTRFTVPIAASDPAERIRAVGTACRAAVSEPGLPLTDTIARGLERLPGAVLTPLFASMLEHVDFFTTNVPGSPVPLFLAGARVERLYAFAPTMGTAVNVSLISWEDLCCIGISIDAGAVADGDGLVACIERSLHEVRSLASSASVATATRPLPTTDEPGGPT